MKRGQKRKQQEEKVSELREKKGRMEDDYSALMAKAERLYEEAETKGALTLLAQGNALRNKAKDKQTDLAKVVKEIAKEEDLLKEM